MWVVLLVEVEVGVGEDEDEDEHEVGGGHREAYWRIE